MKKNKFVLLALLTLPAVSFAEGMSAAMTAVGGEITAGIAAATPFVIAGAVGFATIRLIPRFIRLVGSLGGR